MGLTEFLTAAAASGLVSCPLEPNNAPIAVSAGLINLERSSSVSLCTLTKIITHESGDNTLMPVARSYYGNDWEVSAGVFASIVSPQCATASCSLDLPPLAANENYMLTTLAEPERTYHDKVARFLEQASFGVTKQDLYSNWDASIPLETSIAAWVDDQINSVPMTAHREYYRKRANAPSELSYYYGKPGPKPCENNSRWRYFALTVKDSNKMIRLENSSGSIPGYVVYIDNEARTIVPSTYDLTLTNEPSRTFNIPTFQIGIDYQLCLNSWWGVPMIEEKVNGKIGIKVGGNCFYVAGGNPMVNIDDSDTNLFPHSMTIPLPQTTFIDDQQYGSEFFQGHAASDQLMIVDNTTLNAAECDALPNPWDLENSQGFPIKPIFGKLILDSGHIWMLYDPRHVGLENTPENPLPDGGGRYAAAEGSQSHLQTATVTPYENIMCANVPRSFYNEDSCRLSTDTYACQPQTTIKFAIFLDDEAIVTFYNLTQRWVFAITDLPMPADSQAGIEYEVCKHRRDTYVRFLRMDDATLCNGNTLIEEETATVFANLIREGGNSDLQATALPRVKNVIKRSSVGCASNDVAVVNLGYIMSDNVCWKHVHPDDHNVYDFSTWAGLLPDGSDAKHPGGADMIRNYEYQSKLPFPNSHPLQRWIDSKSNFTLIGTYGDNVQYETLPGVLQNSQLASQLGYVSVNPTGDAIVVCGSPGEVASDPSLGSGYDYNRFERLSGGGTWAVGETTPTSWHVAQKTTIWSNIALKAADQLRQRVAWALSQILVIAPDILGDQRSTESTISFYDIFVRNAFGNYFQVLKEVAFHEKMGEMLSFMDSRSFQWTKDSYSVASYPDENFAREFMQLFSIGLYEMNMDGTPKQDANGDNIPTYGVSDILSFARAWTGFRAQGRRGNVETRVSSMDPMFIEGDYRDPFPKTDLFGGFIGDGTELCVDQPKLQFLRRGAVYRLLGRRDLPEWQEDRDEWNGQASIKRFDVTEGPLYDKLCASSGGECTFPGKVTLDSNLICTNLECNVDTVRVVRVKGPPNPIYYEYIRPPCVEHAFFSDPLRVKDWVEHPTFNVYNFMCADPRRDVAVEACCNLPLNSDQTQRWPFKNCVYNGERMTYSKARERCTETNRITCDFGRFRLWEAGICAEGGNLREWRRDTRLYEFFHWTDTPCSLQVKVNQEGHIAIVHNPGSYTIGQSNVRSLVAEDSENYFKVPWENKLYPQNENVPNECTIVNSNELLCNVDVLEEAVFTGASLPSRDDILLSLHVGAVNPDTFDAGTYSLASSINGVNVYMKDGEPLLGIDTIFKVIDDNGIEKFLKNMKSTVKIVGESYNFRNPVHFISLIDPETRDAYHETDAVIKSIFYHPNTAPFVSRGLIQKFGISNPSPRYISAVANAFKTGLFSFGGIQFGSSKYGDLASTISAIILDREARSAVLDADPAHGSLREPLLKVVSFMRSMDFVRDSPEAVPLLDGLKGKIGQGAHEVESVFSFFLPGYSPSGTIGAGGLVSPEAQVLGTTKTINIVEGLFRLIKYGLSSCDGALNSGYMGPGSCARNSGTEGNNLKRFGYIDFLPTNSDVVDELATLLTSGRLSAENRRIVKNAYDDVKNSNGADQALRVAQQLIASSAEFHSTNVVEKNGRAIGPAPAPVSSVESYKAVVYLFLSGGADTYNVLVPGGASCSLYEEYAEIRGSVALTPAQILSIDATGSNQTCTQFGVNNKVNNLHVAYETDEDCLFFANTGILQKPVTKENWLEETKTPLFSHNSQQRETHKADLAKLSGETGVVGRMMDVLKRNGHLTGSTTIDQGSLALTGSPTENNAVLEVSSRRNNIFNRNPSYSDMTNDLKQLHNATSLNSGRLFADTWSSQLTQAMDQNQEVYDYFNSDSYDPVESFPDNAPGNRLKAVARMIKARTARRVERDAFFVEIQGFDFHSESIGDSTFDSAIEAVDKGVAAFKAEMKNQNLWEKVVLISLSDFGRTLTPNSGSGTDHAWGGNYFMLGGTVIGKRILGEYPSGLNEDAPLNIGRGRIIPTTPWDAVWNGISQWMGVTADVDLDNVLPNRNSFEKCSLFYDEELFHDGTVSKSTCSIQTPTPAPTPSPTLAPTPSPTLAPTPSPTLAPTPSPTPSPTLASTPSTTPSPTPASTPSTTPSPTPASTPSTTPSPTPASTPSTTPSPTPASTPSTTPSPTQASTPSTTPSPTQASTPSTTPSPTQASTPSTTPSPTPASTPSTTPSPTQASTPSTTPSPTPASTPSTTPSPTQASTPSTTPSPTQASTPSTTEKNVKGPKKTKRPKKTKAPKAKAPKKTKGPREAEAPKRSLSLFTSSPTTFAVPLN